MNQDRITAIRAALQAGDPWDNTLVGALPEAMEYIEELEKDRRVLQAEVRQILMAADLNPNLSADRAYDPLRDIVFYNSGRVR